ncbi:uncharacterized protein N7518_005781 [Penicillium psychrosexuale]|uniref:uncharacterized protein n=1 Tax=Penicillium psychrosexuale TaxID=1002107 RepID=UPI002545950F|nr:uncharacterized protein N7518_005781 [Penicillium psychrosexuale]KAJ5797241.1 hypothetical protein N7518_005781 [Penicillium psychrosexuale]
MTMNNIFSSIATSTNHLKAKYHELQEAEQAKIQLDWISEHRQETRRANNIIQREMYSEWQNSLSASHRDASSIDMQKICGTNPNSSGISNRSTANFVAAAALVSVVAVDDLGTPFESLLVKFDICTVREVVDVVPATVVTLLQVRAGRSPAWKLNGRQAPRTSICEQGIALA